MVSTASARLHAIVLGHVQGVGYRMFVIDEARRLDLAGWVRNRSDGSVEVVAEGPRADLDELLWALRSGPHLATVESVEVQWQRASDEFNQFWFLETW